MSYIDELKKQDEIREKEYKEARPRDLAFKLKSEIEYAYRSGENSYKGCITYYDNYDNGKNYYLSSGDTNYGPVGPYDDAWWNYLKDEMEKTIVNDLGFTKYKLKIEDGAMWKRVKGRFKYKDVYDGMGRKLLIEIYW